MTMTDELIKERLAGRCWEVIGVRGGDHSCPELAVHVHCRNCPVFAAAGRTLMERTAPGGYLSEQTANVASAAKPAQRADRSLLIMRLADEWLGLDTSAVTEVVTDRTIHRIPHRTGGAVLGLVNVHGQLQLAASLHKVVGLAESTTRSPTRRLVVTKREQENWVFPVDEVFNAVGFSRDDIQAAPMTVTAALGTHTRGVVDWRDKKVGYLSIESLYAALRRTLG
jgi:chemotaxis-related protein WspD